MSDYRNDAGSDVPIRDAEDVGGRPLCELCGAPMPPGEEMFKFHGYSGPCPTLAPAPREAQPDLCWTGYDDNGRWCVCRLPVGHDGQHGRPREAQPTPPAGEPAAVVALRATRERDDHTLNCNVPDCLECYDLQCKAVRLRSAALDAEPIPPAGEPRIDERGGWDVLLSELHAANLLLTNGDVADAHGEVRKAIALAESMAPPAREGERADTRDGELTIEDAKYAYGLLDQIAEALGVTDGGSEWDGGDIVDAARMAGRAVEDAERREAALRKARQA